MGTPIEPSELRDFIAHTEGKISPKAVSKLYARAEMLSRLPLGIQRWIVAHARGEKYMGFVVDPYAFFLSYELTDMDAAASVLPPGYRLLPSAMFAEESPRPCAIVGAFTVRASVFAGVRVELYVIAENVKTGMLTWIICDYESNTINYDPGQGFSAATTERVPLDQRLWLEGNLSVDYGGHAQHLLTTNYPEASPIHERASLERTVRDLSSAPEHS